MSRDKQIEEMAKIVCNACEMGGGFDGDCALDNDYKTCAISTETAEALYNAGYRKQSDVAMEIFEEIERLHLHITNEFDLRRYNELKKKYTEGGDNIP